MEQKTLNTDKRFVLLKKGEYMITRVFGKKIENYYDIDHKWEQIKDNNGDFKTIYTDKPTIIKETKVKEWTELCSYEGEPRYNSHIGFALYNNINISENETVTIEREIFRADLNEMHLHTNKIVEEVDVNKYDALSILDGQIKAFNKMMIESNNRLMAYCDLHKLPYEDTDCIELFKLVFPDDEYVIENGVMKVSEKLKITSDSGSVYVDNNGRIVDDTRAIIGSVNSISSKLLNAIEGMNTNQM